MTSIHASSIAIFLLKASSSVTKWLQKWYVTPRCVLTSCESRRAPEKIFREICHILVTTDEIFEIQSSDPFPEIDNMTPQWEYFCSSNSILMRHAWHRTTTLIMQYDMGEQIGSKRGYGSLAKNKSCDFSLLIILVGPPDPGTTNMISSGKRIRVVHEWVTRLDSQVGFSPRPAC